MTKGPISACGCSRNAYPDWPLPSLILVILSAHRFGSVVTFITVTFVHLPVNVAKMVWSRAEAAVAPAAAHQK